MPIRRKSEFVKFVHELFESYDVMRYMKQMWVPDSQFISRTKQMLMRRYVESLVPGRDPPLRVLWEFGVSERGMSLVFKLRELYDEGVSAAHSAFLLDKLYEQEGDYVVCSLFFDYVHGHGQVRFVEIQNRTIVQQQIAALCRRFGVDDMADLPPTCGRLALAPCCKRVKTLMANGKNCKAYGHVRIVYNDVEDRYLCARKTEKNETMKQFRKVMRSQFENTPIMRKFERFKRERLKNQESKSEVQKFVELVSVHTDFLQSLDDKDREKISKIRWKERKHVTCIDTDIIFVPLVGRIVELDDYKEIVRRKNSEKLPYWINPCCGQVDYYFSNNWGPNGYACCTCRKMQEATYEALVCELCLKARRRAKPYDTVVLYDDEIGFCFKTYCICKQCSTPDMLAEGGVVSVSVARDKKRQMQEGEGAAGGRSGGGGGGGKWRGGSRKSLAKRR